MTLTQQFLLISLLPASFLGMIIYLWRARVKRRPLYGRWSLTLLLAAIWASSILRHFGGVSMPEIVVFNWGLVGSYTLPLTAVGLLLTTTTYLNLSKGYSRLTVLLTAVLLAIAMGLEPQVRSTPLTLQLGGEAISHFHLWTAVWTASWLLPVTGAWILTQQQRANLPASLYRNQLNYWLVVVVIFLLGFAVGSLYGPNQLSWQQLSVLILMAGAAVGTITLSQLHLPRLQLAARQLLSRLSGVLILFGITWLTLSFIVQAVTNLPAETAVSSQSLILIIAAALFAAFFTLVYRWVNVFTRRLFLHDQSRRDVALAQFSNVLGNMPEPAQLGQMFLRVVQSNLATDEAWLFKADDGPGGRLVLRPLASLGNPPYTITDFSPDSPITQHWRQQKSPLIQSDLDTLEQFAAIPDSERGLLARWQRVLFQPLHAGDSLVAVLALGARYTGEGYNERDLAKLHHWAAELSPLLVQAHNLATLRKMNDFVFNQNQALMREKQYLQELGHLYSDFIDMISPELRRPFTNINRELQKYQAKASDKENQFVGEISQQIGALRTPIDDLITMAARIQMRSQYEFKPIQLAELAQEAIHNLRNMADARRVQIEFQSESNQTNILGDPQQLLEAVQHLLHNAVKFNKIGGFVEVQCGNEGAYVYLRLIDNGVGIPADRLENLWGGLNSAHKNGHNNRAGMGLTLAQFILKAHGGYIQAESKYGSGSTFTLYLPLVYADR